jgi:hypothetical protein
MESGGTEVYTEEQASTSGVKGDESYYQDHEMEEHDQYMYGEDDDEVEGNRCFLLFNQFNVFVK